jgi:hypothetical protein
MLVPYDMSSKQPRPPSDGWQKITAFGIFATMATVVIVTTGSASELVPIAPYLLMLLNVRTPRR